MVRGAADGPTKAAAVAQRANARIMACGRRALARSLFDSVRARENGEAVLKQVYTNSERADAVAGAVSFLSMPLPRAGFPGVLAGLQRRCERPRRATWALTPLSLCVVCWLSAFASFAVRAGAFEAQHDARG